MARRRKYGSPKAQREAIEEYFRSISRTIEVQEAYNTGEKDSWGHFIYELRTVKNDDGTPIRRVEYLVPPSISALCRALGISRTTWGDYCDEEKNPELHTLTTQARERIESWYIEQLLTRTKGTRGIEFVLQNGFGWQEKKEVDVGPQARKLIAAEKLPLEEKEALLRSIAAEFAGEQT